MTGINFIFIVYALIWKHLLIMIGTYMIGPEDMEMGYLGYHGKLRDPMIKLRE